MDSHLPNAVLAKINDFTNKYFIEKNRQIIAHSTNGGGDRAQNNCNLKDSTAKTPNKTHFGYFDFDSNSQNPKIL